MIQLSTKIIKVNDGILVFNLPVIANISSQMQHPHQALHPRWPPLSTPLLLLMVMPMVVVTMKAIIFLFVYVDTLSVIVTLTILFF